MSTIIQCVNNLDLGGLERMVLSLASQLKTRGCNSLICCIENRGTLAAEVEQLGIPVHAIEMERHGKWVGFRNLRRWLASQPQPVILHSHNFKPFYYSALAKITGAATGHIHTRHGAFIRQHRATWRYRLLRRGINRIITVSEDGRRELSRMSGLPIEQISAIPNGIETDFFAPATDRVQIRTALGVPVNEKVIIVVARLAPEKDLGTLLRAFSIVQRQLPAATLWIVGDGPERERLTALSHELGGASQIRFWGARSDIRNLLQAADVFALTSLSEGLSIALIEAAACGLPIVATNVGGNPQIVNAPVGGQLVEPRNPEALAAALLAILNDDTGRQVLGKAARQHAVEKFSIRQMVDGYLNLYQQACGERPL